MEWRCVGGCGNCEVTDSLRRKSMERSNVQSYKLSEMNMNAFMRHILISTCNQGRTNKRAFCTQTLAHRGSARGPAITSGLLTLVPILALTSAKHLTGRTARYIRIWEFYFAFKLCCCVTTAWNHRSYNLHELFKYSV